MRRAFTTKVTEDVMTMTSVVELAFGIVPQTKDVVASVVVDPLVTTLGIRLFELVPLHNSRSFSTCIILAVLRIQSKRRMYDTLIGGVFTTLKYRGTVLTEGQLQYDYVL